MGTKGRKPKPSELRLIEGNREHRPILINPKPRPVYPRAPRWIDPAAKKEWKKMMPALYRLGLLTEIDITALAAYCQCFAKWKEAEIKAIIGIFKTDTGYISQNPYINIALKYEKAMRAYLTEFGMTPSSRTRLSTNEAEEENQMETLLKHGRNK